MRVTIADARAADHVDGQEAGFGRKNRQQEGRAAPAVNTKRARARARRGFPQLRPEGGPASSGDPPPRRAVLTASPRSLPRG